MATRAASPNDGNLSSLQLRSFRVLTDGSIVQALANPDGTNINSANPITTSSSANALTTGPNGATNPSFNVDASAASAVTGLNVKAAAAGSGIQLQAISSATNEPLTLDAKGSGSLVFGSNSTGLIVFGRASGKVLIIGSALASLATQNTTPTAAQLLGGYIEHASTTGAGTATLDTAANIVTAVTNATTGDTFDCSYANTGSQTVTITTNTGLTLKGTVAIPAGKNATLNFRLTGGGNVTVYCSVSA